MRSALTVSRPAPQSMTSRRPSAAEIVSLPAPATSRFLPLETTSLSACAVPNWTSAFAACVLPEEAAAGAATATALASETELAEPAELDAVTKTRTVEPRSACWSLYDAPLAPAIGAQPWPCVSQRCH